MAKPDRASSTAVDELVAALTHTVRLELAAAVAAVVRAEIQAQSSSVPDAGPHPQRHDPTALLTVPEAAVELRIGRTHLYKFIKQGRIRPVKLSGRTLIPYREIERFVAELMASARAPE